MPYRLIIVDDEDVIREGLANVINWNQLGFEIAGKFADGSQAVAYMEINPVDVILSDVKMQLVSGIELAKYVYKNHPQIKVVLISGYKEFELVQQAMMFHVSYYLLKPTRIDEIQSCFNNVKQDLDTYNMNLESQKLNEQKIKNYEDKISFYEEQFFLDIIMDSSQSDETILDKLRLSNIPVSGFSLKGCLMSISFDEKIGLNNWNYGKENFYQAIKNMLQNVYSVKFVPVNYISSGVQLLVFDASGVNNEFFSYIKQLSNVLTKQIKDLLFTNVSIQIVYDIYNISELKQVKKYIFLSRDQEGYSREALTNYGTISEYEKILISDLFEGDSAKVNDVFSNYTDELYKYDYRTANEAVKSFFKIVYKELENINLTLSGLTHRNFKPELFDHLSGPEEIKHWGKKILDNIAQYVADNKIVSRNHVISKVNKYIEENYNKDITLYDLADAVYHNPVYLSRLYKEKTGENYLDYLTKTRIDHAKKLLENRKYKIYDVSTMVGYKSNKYFSKLFKGYTGMNPTEYRDSVIGE